MAALVILQTVVTQIFPGDILGNLYSDPLPVTSGFIDSTGTQINPDSLPQTLTYNGDGTVNTISVTNGTNTWTQTFTYTTGKVTGISKWVKS